MNVWHSFLINLTFANHLSGPENMTVITSTRWFRAKRKAPNNGHNMYARGRHVKMVAPRQDIIHPVPPVAQRVSGTVYIDATGRHRWWIKNRLAIICSVNECRNIAYHSVNGHKMCGRHKQTPQVKVEPDDLRTVPVCPRSSNQRKSKHATTVIESEASSARQSTSMRDAIVAEIVRTTRECNITVVGSPDYATIVREIMDRHMAQQRP